MSITVAIADDQPLVRAGLRMIIDAAEGLRLIAEATNGKEAVEAARRARPDVLLMDIRMPLIDGLEATRQITAIEQPTRVLVLTTFELDEYIYGALKAGASGFLLKDIAPEHLVNGIKTVAAGDALLSPSVTTRLIESYLQGQAHTPPPPALGNLTPRELEIFKLVARGLSNAEIAGRLFLSNATVKTHVTRALTKLGLRDRAQAVVLAYETAIVRPGEQH
jgi:DNA-binding NarL/FixJ family response regulator